MTNSLSMSYCEVNTNQCQTIEKELVEVYCTLGLMEVTVAFGQYIRLTKCASRVRQRRSNWRVWSSPKVSRLRHNCSSQNGSERELTPAANKRRWRRVEPHLMSPRSKREKIQVWVKRRWYCGGMLAFSSMDLLPARVPNPDSVLNRVIDILSRWNSSMLLHHQIKGINFSWFDTGHNDRISSQSSDTTIHERIIQ